MEMLPVDLNTPRESLSQVYWWKMSLKMLSGYVVMNFLFRFIPFFKCRQVQILNTHDRINIFKIQKNLITRLTS